MDLGLDIVLQILYCDLHFSTWTSQDDVKDSPRHDYRSASLDELTNIGIPVGLPILSPGDLKHK